MTVTDLLLPIITGLLGIIATILCYGVRLFYDTLQEILQEVNGHRDRLVALETWEREHKEEMTIQRQQWREEADRVWAVIDRLRANGPTAR